MLLSEVNATTPAGKNALKKWIGFNFVSVKRQEEYGFRTNTLKRMDSPRFVMLEMMLNSSSGTTSAVIALDQMEPTAPT